MQVMAHATQWFSMNITIQDWSGAKESSAERHHRAPMITLGREESQTDASSKRVYRQCALKSRDVIA
jgi:hypothetical protein